MDVEKIVSDKVKELVENKTIENLISKSIETTILNEIKRVFTSYQFASSIEKLIKDQIGDIASIVKLNSYNTLISKTIEDVLNNSVKEDLKEKIQNVIKNQFIVTDKEIKLSDVVKAFKDTIDEDEEYSYSVTIESRESSFNFVHKKIIFYNDKTDETEVVIELMTDSNGEGLTITGVRYDDFNIENIATLRSYNDFECMLIKGYLNGLQFVIDMTESECESELYNSNDC